MSLRFRAYVIALTNDTRGLKPRFRVRILALFRSKVPKIETARPLEFGRAAHFSASGLPGEREFWAPTSNYFDACNCVALVAETKSCVPLSRCTFLLADVMSEPEPCAAPTADEVRFSPCILKTPWLFEVS